MTTTEPQPSRQKFLEMIVTTICFSLLITLLTGLYVSYEHIAFAVPIGLFSVGYVFTMLNVVFHDV